MHNYICRWVIYNVIRMSIYSIHLTVASSGEHTLHSPWSSPPWIKDEQQWQWARSCCGQDPLVFMSVNCTLGISLFGREIVVRTQLFTLLTGMSAWGDRMVCNRSGIEFDPLLLNVAKPLLVKIHTWWWEGYLLCFTIGASRGATCWNKKQFLYSHYDNIIMTTAEERWECISVNYSPLPSSPASLVFLCAEFTQLRWK